MGRGLQTGGQEIPLGRQVVVGGGGHAYGRGAALDAAGLARLWLQRKEPGEWWDQEGELWINTDPRVRWRRAML